MFTILDSESSFELLNTKGGSVLNMLNVLERIYLYREIIVSSISEIAIFHNTDITA